MARFAPSGANIQPWRVYVLGGAEKDRVSRSAAEGAPEAPISISSEYQYYAPQLPEPYLSRRAAVRPAVLRQRSGIQQSDMAGRARRQTAKNYGFFGAPVGLIITIDRRLQVGSWLDLGMFVAERHARGAAPADCRPVRRRRSPNTTRCCGQLLPIPAEEMVVCGMSIGFAEEAWARAGGLMPKARCERVREIRRLRRTITSKGE